MYICNMYIIYIYMYVAGNIEARAFAGGTKRGSVLIVHMTKRSTEFQLIYGWQSLLFCKFLYVLCAVYTYTSMHVSMHT